MFHVPEYDQNVSLQLSEVLHDIGVNDRMIVKRRRAQLLQETIYTISRRLSGHQQSVYYLGSQIEGTTTRGLNSDRDVLFCINDAIVIQDWAEWSPCKINSLLMIQDDTTPSGYCYIQNIRSDIPLPHTEEEGNHFVKDTHGRVLIKNTLIDDYLPGDQQRQGPSIATEGVPGFSDIDKVPSFPLKSLPNSVRHWLDQAHSRWPTANMIRYAAACKCLVVPTGSSVSENKDFQWRISTSLAERCFMLNLNITQIRCYILLKMILKTFINLHGQKYITSYMCKTVLFHYIRSKPSYVWKESDILNCLRYCLSTLHRCILSSNCPHFILHGNNLMAGKISIENKHMLLEQMSNLIRHTAACLLRIQIDNLGQKLLLKLNIINGVDYNGTFFIDNTEQSLLAAGELLINTADTFESAYTEVLLRLKNRRLEAQMLSLLQTVVNLVGYHTERNLFVQAACRLLTPFFCTSLGSMMASYNIQHNNHVSPQALGLLSAGINSDVSSSRLKLASVFYCTGDMESAAFMLRDTEERYNIYAVDPVCGCYHQLKSSLKKGFVILATHYNEETMKYITAYCVKFLPSEINCVPKELQYEMFRSTRVELLQRHKDDAWMDLAVVDSIPYLYFLQYKTFGYLQRIQAQQEALNKLVVVTQHEENLKHRETAWNLVGQCMEQENRLDHALQCYRNSLHVRQTNNVARIHICMLLFRLARENNL